MKKTFLLLAIAAAFVACKNDTTTGDTPKDSTASATVPTDLAYSIKDYVGYEWGSNENLKTALLTLKAFETGSVDESAKYFADSAILEFDYYSATLSKDSIMASLKKDRSQFKAFTIEMADYESVKSKDGKSEYVSLWYKQKWEDNAGKKDSVECMNDIKMKNGKIVLLNEKTRHYPVAKK